MEFHTIRPTTLWRRLHHNIRERNIQCLFQCGPCILRAPRTYKRHEYGYPCQSYSTDPWLFPSRGAPTWSWWQVLQPCRIPHIFTGIKRFSVYCLILALHRLFAAMLFSHLPFQLQQNGGKKSFVSMPWFLSDITGKCKLSNRV